MNSLKRDENYSSSAGFLCKFFYALKKWIPWKGTKTSSRLLPLVSVCQKIKEMNSLKRDENSESNSFLRCNHTIKEMNSLKRDENKHLSDSYVIVLSLLKKWIPWKGTKTYPLVSNFLITSIKEMNSLKRDENTFYFIFKKFN